MSAATGQRVLVTGGRSLLGGAVARLLADRGDRVTVLQRRPSGLGLPEVLADLSDRDAVRRAIARPSPTSPPPLWPLAVTPLPRWNASKMQSCSDSGMPTPLSQTSMRSCAPRLRQPTTTPPVCV